jgi:hypothetical protein
MKLLTEWRCASLRCAHIHDGLADRKKGKICSRVVETPGADHIKKLSRGPQPATLRRPQPCVPFASAQTHTGV